MSHSCITQSQIRPPYLLLFCFFFHHFFIAFGSNPQFWKQWPSNIINTHIFCYSLLLRPGQLVTQTRQHLFFFHFHIDASPPSWYLTCVTHPCVTFCLVLSICFKVWAFLHFGFRFTSLSQVLFSSFKGSFLNLVSALVFHIAAAIVFGLS